MVFLADHSNGAYSVSGVFVLSTLIAGKIAGQTKHRDIVATEDELTKSHLVQVSSLHSELA